MDRHRRCFVLRYNDGDNYPDEENEDGIRN